MRRAGTFLLLLAGLLTGWLLGHTAETVAGVSRAPRTVTVVERVEVNVPVPVERLVAEEWLPVVRPAASSEPNVHVPLEPVEIEPGFGLLVFDGRCEEETCGAEIYRVDLYGDSCTHEGETVSEGIQHFALVPGVYDLVWSHADLAVERSARVRLDAGHVTRVAASEPFERDQFYIPPGLGAVDVQVLDLAGEPVAVDWLSIGRIDLTGDWEEHDASTDENGRHWVALHPGEYLLRIGAHRMRVLVEAGRTTSVLVRPGWQGELRFDRVPEGILDIARIDASEEETYCEAHGEARYLFLRPGRYRVEHKLGIESNWRPVGEIDIRARQAVTMALPPLPEGEVVVGLYTADSPSSFEATLRADPLDGQPGAVPVVRRIKTRGMGLPFAAKLVALHPGHWRVHAKVDGFHAVERVVKVGAERVNLQLWFDPEQ